MLRVLAGEKDTTRAIIASDISPQMLAIAQQRLGSHWGRVKFELLDMEGMPAIASGSVDAYSVSLGLKICDREKALGEALRVLKPGGRLIILEASNIPVRLVHRMYLAYMNVCMPALGWLATGGDASAYRYLLDGVSGFPSADELAAEMLECGFTNVRYRRLSMGIVAIHIAEKPHVAIADANR
jgi:demethylmenaquinone methyltransferase/2-methoxy-6-polyprenyl-1,4-benzoquinol methylase